MQGWPFTLDGQNILRQRKAGGGGKEGSMVMSYLAGDKELGVKRGDGLDCLAALEWCCLEGNACWSGGTGR